MSKETGDPPEGWGLSEPVRVSKETGDPPEGWGLSEPVRVSKETGDPPEGWGLSRARKSEGEETGEQVKMQMRVRKAKINDIGAVHKIINEFASRGDMLPRSLSELYDHLRDYLVAEEDKQEAVIVGVCGLGICWEGLAEIKSLAVIASHQGKGYGKELVEASLEEARNLGVKRVFTLTYIPEFFQKMGFEEIDKSQLPHKIWADCLKCPQFPNCEEVALIRYL